MTAPVLDRAPAALTGRQEPHHLLQAEPVPEWERRGAAAVTLSNRIAGDKPLFPWQADEMRGILRWDPVSGLWLHSTCVLIIPRQNGKSEVLLYRCVYGLFVLNETIVFSVQRWKTGRVIAQRLIKMIEAIPSLRSKLKKKPTMSQGMAEIQLRSGASITFITRSPDSGTGLDAVDLLIYDEAYNLTEGDTSALDPTIMASDNPQTIYTSSAVNADIHTNGLVLTALREDALAATSPNGLYFAEHMAPPEMDRDEPETWRYANPSFGIIQTDAKMRDALRKQKTERSRRIFDVNFLGRGVWPKLVDTGEALYADEVLEAAKAPNDLHLRGSVAISIDRSYVGRDWAIVAATFADDGAPYLEVGFVGKATNAAMVRKVKALVDLWDPIIIIDRKSAAAPLIALLKAEDIVPEVTGADKMAVACQGIEADLLDAQMYLADQPAIIDAFGSATKRLMPQGDWAWNRAEGGASIAPLVAMTMARWGLIEFGIDTGGALPALDAATGEQWPQDFDFDDFDAMAAGF
ncbi:hypothetical protein ACFQNE_02005 [Gordonia phosphorivorans]|uniref:Terminase n=1 Tax=Gordonia phosphorivorans TaxID=1056982 RepID=A0ABV6H6I9_9ACTN